MVGPLRRHVDDRLRQLACGRRGDPGVSLRARMIRMLAYDPCVSTVATRLDVDVKTVRLWRDRFVAGGVEALRDAPRSGRPPRISDVERCEIIAMACGRPGDFGVRFRETWTIDSLCETFRERRPDVQISRTSVLRVLNGGDVHPHRMQCWMHSPDPDFRAKATAICGLYRSPPAGVVLCIDEKTGMQALSRRHPTKWPTQGRPGRWEFEYRRNGTRTLIAAFEVGTAKVYGEVRKTRTGEDLVAFMEEIARRYPTGPVHIVWDNLNIHYDGKDRRWTAFNERHGGRFHFHYTPLHASWVNQVELFFAKVQKRVLRHASFVSALALGKAVLGFIHHWNRVERRPFRWTFGGYPSEMAKKTP